MEEKVTYFLHPGYMFMSKEAHLIHTVLGSCVSVCIWDNNLKYGGMTHYIHSKPFHNEKSPQFGSICIPYLLKYMKDNGSQKSNLQAHVIGGAQNSQLGSIEIGENNVKVAIELLHKYGINIITKDTGGHMGRKVVFDNSSGEILVFKVNSIRRDDWYANN